MSFKQKVTALILAGGRGTRMGRVDKGLQPFRGATLVSHVMRRLAPQVAALAINANRNLPQYQALFASDPVPVWPDELGGFEGPLAGLQTGLRHCGTELLATAPCDSPFLPADLVERLHAALLADDADLAIAVTMETDQDGRPYRQTHPVFTLMKTAVLAQLNAYLDTGARRLDGWHKAIRVTEVLFDDAAAFRNLNTLGELQHYERAAPEAAPVPTSASVAATAAGCLSAYDPEALSVGDAQRIIADFIEPIQAVERVALRSALDRVLAEDIVSPICVPAHDNSAMDGYALRAADLAADAPTTLRIAGVVYAGRPVETALAPGDCMRIMTGGVMPAGADCVLPQELATAVGATSVTIAPGLLRAGDNRRLRGEDLHTGSPALAKGRIVRPADLGLLASLGIAEVAVRRRLRVAFFSTGDELRSVGDALDPGCVYDSNRYTLYGMLLRLGCDVIDMGVVRDDPAALEAALRSACENADAIVTSGGVSVGAADYTKQIMAALGDVTFWKLNMRPGRPLAFGKIASNGRSAFLFGLPGNPVAVMVSFYCFARAALLRMMGVDAGAAPPLLRARASSAIRKKIGRTEYQRAIVRGGADGAPEVCITGAQGSGILRSMSQANCMVVLHDEQGDVAAGDMVDLMLFDGLV
ncbi:gephyrin-like molybdotransferase Glp [Rugamonas sp.]|uniref:molybdopterin molybdotransferase MoeA n=1 Tax=Rugamonas sp. TaxID=1926287 RepID=UPI0025E6F458|nr:gephyrin-like molybdotransferase Glp [Rugamonas sp.]